MQKRQMFSLFSNFPIISKYIFKYLMAYEECIDGEYVHNT